MKMIRNLTYVIIALILIVIVILLYNKPSLEDQTTKKLHEWILYYEASISNEKGEELNRERQYIDKLNNINIKHLINDGGAIIIAVLYKDDFHNTKFDLRWIALSPQINKICIESEDGKKNFIEIPEGLKPKDKMQFIPCAIIEYPIKIDYSELMKGKAYLVTEDNLPVGQAINIEIIKVDKLDVVPFFKNDFEFFPFENNK